MRGVIQEREEHKVQETVTPTQESRQINSQDNIRSETYRVSCTTGLEYNHFILGKSFKGKNQG